MAKAKVKRPRPGSRAESLINEDPAAIVARINRATKAFMAKIHPDIQALIAADGGMEAVNERLLGDMEKLGEELAGTVEYLNEQLG